MNAKTTVFKRSYICYYAISMSVPLTCNKKNKAKQCENLKKNLKGVNTCYFLTISVKSFAK